MPSIGGIEVAVKTIILRKLDRHGQSLLHINIPLQDLPDGTTDEDVPNVNMFNYVGPNGQLRASQRRLEQGPQLSAEQASMLYPVDIWRQHDRVEKMPPSEIVCLEIALWPGGMIFEAGKSVRLELKGHEATLPEFPALQRVPTNLNIGYHIVRPGPEHPSSVILPLASKALS